MAEGRSGSKLTVPTIQLTCLLMAQVRTFIGIVGEALADEKASVVYQRKS